MRIFDVPIEPFESRYSLQWRNWFLREYDHAKIEWVPISGDLLTGEIETGSFLDVHGTNYYKAGQLQRLIASLKAGSIRDGDVILFHDLWFPGIEMLEYIRNATRVKFKIAGCLHAGSWDQYDFVNRVGMSKWTRYFERMLFRIVDYVFLATEFHRTLIVSHHPHALSKLHVTGFPIYPDEFCAFVKQDEVKKGLVVFPHRLDPEKQPHLFDELSENERLKKAGLTFVKTKDVCKTKKEYYELLAKAEYAISFSLQETWGIAMQEALFSGCISLVPDRLAYGELYEAVLRYTSMEEAVHKLLHCHTNDLARQAFRKACLETDKRLERSGRHAIQNMLAVMDFDAHPRADIEEIK